MSKWKVENSECLAALKRCPSDFFDSMCTDPPSGTGFMGKDWDCFRRRHNPADVGRDNVHGRMSAHAPHSYGESDRGNFIAFMTEVMKEALRVLKPGAHCLVWALPRTSHWTATALEDAGFEVRDCITHHFGSGFPKSADISKAIDKMRNDNVRPVCRFLRSSMEEAQKTSKEIADTFGYHSRMVDHWAARDTDSQPTVPTCEQWNVLKEVLNFGDAMDAEVWRLNGRKGQLGEAYAGREAIGTYKNDPGGFGEYRFPVVDNRITLPATDEAKTWDGWGTALKPATEMWWLARKPLAASSIARNVLTHGTGALNIAGTRVAHNEAPGSPCIGLAGKRGGIMGETVVRVRETTSASVDGRWPPNLLLSHSESCADECAADCPVAELDGQSGVTQSKRALNRRGVTTGTSIGGYSAYGTCAPQEAMSGHNDSGGASRFFPTFRYQAKPARGEKEAGLDALPVSTLNRVNPGGLENEPRFAPVQVKNNHPTVKSIELMRWLCRLITPPGGAVLDPFAGSGSTGVGALLEGFDFFGIEQDPHYVEICRARLAHWGKHGTTT